MTLEDGPSRVKAVHYVHESVSPEVRQYNDYASTYALTQTPIVLDTGVTWMRAGWANERDPRILCESVVSKYRDRKAGRPILLAGSTAHLDHNSRVSAKIPFEGDTIVNMDTMEHLLDYVFVKLGIQTEGSIPHPIAMTETLGNPLACRSMMSEMLFEGYRVPSVSYSIDSLASFYYSGLSDGLVISSSTTSTHIIPVLDGKGILSSSKRIAWGGAQAADYLLKLVQLKYPNFPTRVTMPQSISLFRDHCYYSLDYSETIQKLADPTKMAEMGRVVQFPFTTLEVYETPEEVVLKMQEKKREQGRRLQAQAAAVRQEKMLQKEADLAAFMAIKESKATEKKGDYSKRVQLAGFRSEHEMNDTIAKLDKSLRRARNREMGIDDEVDKEIPSFPLVDIPDHQLTEAEIKEKRRQKLNKAGYDARMRMKAERDATKAQEVEALLIDDEHRSRDFEGWLSEKKAQQDSIIDRIKQRKEVKAQLGDRKSFAAQQRMKTITTMASEGPSGKKKRKKEDDDDTFGAHDDDWAVYRDIGAEDSEAEEEEQAQLQKIETTLLKYDPNFTVNSTAARREQAKQSLLNAFARGLAPGEPLDLFDSANPEHAAQLHLNVERIRVPEVTFQPSLAGIDSAGLLEVIEHILKSFSSSERDRLTNNVFTTGGYSLVSQYGSRLSRELTSVLPVGTPVSVRRAADPQLDAWRGLTKFVNTDRYRETAVTLTDYYEKGGEYIKEHELSNIYRLLSL